jgi:hypothetical protein
LIADYNNDESKRQRLNDGKAASTGCDWKGKISDYE